MKFGHLAERFFSGPRKLLMDNGIFLRIIGSEPLICGGLSRQSSGANGVLAVFGGF